MIKLQQLAQHIEQSQLNFAKENVLSYASDGNVLAPAGDHHTENYNFKLSYTGNLIIVNCTLSLGVLMTVVTKWFNQHEPHHSDDAIKFAIDINKNNSFDIHITLPLTEIIKTTELAQGTQVSMDTPADIENAMLNALFKPTGNSADNGTKAANNEKRTNER